MMKIKLVVLLFAFALLWDQTVQAGVDPFHVNKEDSFVRVNNNPWQPEKFENATIIPASFIKVPGITLDGKDDEPDWSSATEIAVAMSYGQVANAWLKAIYTEEEVYIRVRWEDATEDREHHPWVWDSEGKRYVAGAQVEDSLILSFEGGCWWTPSILAGYVFDFDGWQWLAARSDPVGQAVDIDGSVSRPRGNSEEWYQSRKTGSFWNVKFTEDEEESFYKTWDKLDRIYSREAAQDTMQFQVHPDRSRSRQLGKRLPAPENAPESEQQTFPQFEAVRLEGDAGDVSAKGRWENGFWTVELRRALVTPSKTVTDSVFNRLTQFSVHIFNHVERIDQSSESGRLYLQFMERERLLTKE